MQSQLLKLNAPYNVIYAGGLVGRHIATLVTWNEDERGEMLDTESFPVLDMGEEYPAGKLVNVDLDDCRVLCPDGATNLNWVAKMIEYDFQQELPSGADYILKRMKLLGCKIAMPKGDDDSREYQATLYRMRFKGSGNDADATYRVTSNRHQGFYFESEGTAEEVYNDLSLQLHTYLGHFPDDVSRICFKTFDGELTKVINRLNAEQMIEGYTYEADDE